MVHTNSTNKANKTFDIYGNKINDLGTFFPQIYRNTCRNYYYFSTLYQIEKEIIF